MQSIGQQRLVRGDSSRLKRTLEEMIEAATIDCYSESEQVTGFFILINENLAVPFETTVFGLQSPSSA